ncbi:MAG: NAD(+)/NADH kinase, partial [Lachnospiraceae bacterium]|nr:NAD(+)/NADH kinase [Lachnospiraceae bacterium]
MKHFYVIVNEDKLDAVDMKLDIVEYLESRGATCKASRGEFSKGCPFTCVEDVPPETECVITLGGDGTLIRAARDLAGSGLPIIGINMGTLGYLTQMGRDGDPKELLDALLEDRYEIHERMMLRGRVFHNDECIAEDIALNDIVLTREGELRVLKFELYVDGQFLTEYSADGMIVSTPTGSTAYNLSAGGPIAQPDGEMIILTPVCPHTLTSRTIVLGPNCKVRIRIPMKSRGYRMVSFDGDTQVSLDRGDYYEIEKADMVT